MLDAGSVEEAREVLALPDQVRVGVRVVGDRGPSVGCYVLVQGVLIQARLPGANLAVLLCLQLCMRLAGHRPVRQPDEHAPAVQHRQCGGGPRRHVRRAAANRQRLVLPRQPLPAAAAGTACERTAVGHAVACWHACWQGVPGTQPGRCMSWSHDGLCITMPHAQGKVALSHVPPCVPL